MTFSIGPFGPTVGVRLPTTATASNFFGDPNVFITSITPGIDASRTSGTWPFAIQVSASATTAAGSTRPYEDLEYTWDFGDTGTPRTMVNPVTGLTVNCSTDQRGPEAAYIYDGSGSATRTITLTAKGRTVFGGVITQTTQLVVSIADKGGTHKYYNSNIVGGDGTGSSAANASTSASALRTSFLSGQNIHIAQGSTFTLSDGNVFRCGGSLHVDTYDSGNGSARPILTSQSVSPAGSQGTFYLENQFGGTKDDIYIKGIQFSVNDGTAFAWRAYFQQGSDVVSNVYFDDCYIPYGQLDKNADDTKQVKWGFWNCVTSQTATAGVANAWFLGTATQWLFFMGGGPTCNTNNYHDIFTHWLYTGCNYHSLYRWVDFVQGNVSFAINGNCHTPNPQITGSVLECPYHLVSDCRVTGADWSFDSSNSPSNQSDGLFSNYIVQFCKMSPNKGITFFFSCTSRVERDNMAYNFTTNPYASPSGLQSLLTLKIYRNKLYTPHSLITLDSSWTLPKYFTDNIIYCTSSSAEIIRINSATEIAAGSIIDRNQYYAPNDSNGQLFSVSGTNNPNTTFAGWKLLGFDVNGSYGNPGWIDPANGNFNTP